MAKQKSWKQIVREADPDHGKDNEKDAYIFSCKNSVSIITEF